MTLEELIIKIRGEISEATTASDIFRHVRESGGDMGQAVGVLWKELGIPLAEARRIVETSEYYTNNSGVSMDKANESVEPYINKYRYRRRGIK